MKRKTGIFALVTAICFVISFVFPESSLISIYSFYFGLIFLMIFFILVVIERTSSRKYGRTYNPATGKQLDYLDHLRPLGLGRKPTSSADASDLIQKWLKIRRSVIFVLILVGLASIFIIPFVQNLTNP